MTDQNSPPPDDPKEPSEKAPRPEGSSNDEYKVGPGRPPKEHTWKKGGPSPNPKGRKKKEPPMAPDLKQALEDALNSKVKLTKDEKQRSVTKAKLGIEQLVNQYAKGDRYARRDLIDYAQRLGVDLLAGARKTIEALTPDHQAILDAYINQRIGKTDVTPSSPVIAPAELLDDDVVQPERSPDETARPSAPSEPPPKQLPQTSQDVREERLRRRKLQADFDAARADEAELAANAVDATSVKPAASPSELASGDLPSGQPAALSAVPDRPAPLPTPACRADPIEIASSVSEDGKSASTAAKLDEGAPAPIAPPVPNSPPSQELQNGKLGNAPTHAAAGLSTAPLRKRPVTAQELRNEKMRLKRLQRDAGGATDLPASASGHPDQAALQPPAAAGSASHSPGAQLPSSLKKQAGQ